MRFLLIGSLVALGVMFGVSCNNSDFAGGSSTKKKTSKPAAKTKKSKDTKSDSESDFQDEDEDQDAEYGDEGFDTDAVGVDEPAGDFDADTAGPISIDEDNTILKIVNPELREIHQFWTVTMNGQIKYFQLKGKSIVQEKSWSYTQGTMGARTYMLENGALVFVRMGGHMYWIHPTETPEGAINESAGSANYFKIPSGGVGARLCVVAYIKGGQRTLGVGYGSGNFFELKLQNTPPFAPIWSIENQIQAPQGNQWGYSCYIDQEKLIYHGSWRGEGSSTALDLSTMTFTGAGGAASAPGNPDPFGIPILNGAYAISGGNGQVFNKQGAYTFSFNKKTDVVWSTSGIFGNGPVNLAKRSCFAAGCSGTQGGSFEVGDIGPISSLPTGDVIGLARRTGDIFLMSQNDAADVSAGIEVTKLGNAGGDPYMYTDFTGSTLYKDTTLTEFDLDGHASYESDKHLKKLSFQWTAVP